MLGTLIATGASLLGDFIYNNVPAVSEAIDSVLWPIAGTVTGKSQQDVAAALDVKYNTTKYGDKYQEKNTKEQLQKLQTGKTDKTVVLSTTPVVTTAKVATPEAVKNSTVNTPLKNGQVAATEAAKAKVADKTLVTPIDMSRAAISESTGIEYTASDYAKKQAEKTQVVDPAVIDPVYSGSNLQPIVYGGDTTVRIYNPPVTTFETYNYYEERKGSNAMLNDANTGSNIRLVNGKW